mgnify:CR=1 FL=1
MVVKRTGFTGDLRCPDPVLSSYLSDCPALGNFQDRLHALDDKQAVAEAWRNLVACGVDQPPAGARRL